MAFEQPQPRFGARVPVAQRLRRARRHRSRQGRRAGPGRAGTQQQPWDWAGPSRASSQAAAKPSHPRRWAGTEGPLQTRPSSAHGVCAAGGDGRCPTVPGFLGNGGASIPDWGGQRLGTLRATFSRHPKIAFFAIGIHKTCLLKIRTKPSPGNFAVDTGWP